MKFYRLLPPSFFILFICFCSLCFSGCSSSSEKKPKELYQTPSLPESEMLDSAMKAYDKGLFTVAKQSWTDLRDGYPGSYFSTLAELKLADSLFYSASFTDAVAQYDEFAQLHPGHEAIPYVRYQIANCNMEQYKSESQDQAPLITAIGLYEQILKEHPHSEYAGLSRIRIAQAREKLANHELLVAQFYLKQGYPEASARRIARLKLDYPDTPTVRRISEVMKDDEPESVLAMQQKLESASNAEKASQPKNLKNPSPRRAPGSPQFLLPNSTSIDSTAATNAQTTKPSAPEMISRLELNSPEKTSQSAAPIVPPVTFTCETLENGAAITIMTGRAVRVEEKAIESKSARNSQALTLLLTKEKTGLKKSEEAVQSLAFHLENTHLDCNSPDVSLSASTSEENSELKLEFSVPTGWTHAVMKLDRPHRVLFVTRPKS